MSEDCYFFSDKNAEGEEVMRSMCAKCHDEKYPNTGWYWPGGLKGYGPYDILCKYCDRVIHQAPKES